MCNSCNYRIRCSHTRILGIHNSYNGSWAACDNHDANLIYGECQNCNINVDSRMKLAGEENEFIRRSANDAWLLNYRAIERFLFVQNKFLIAVCFSRISLLLVVLHGRMAVACNRERELSANTWSIHENKSVRVFVHWLVHTEYVHFFFENEMRTLTPTNSNVCGFYGDVDRGWLTHVHVLRTRVRSNVVGSPNPFLVFVNSLPGVDGSRLVHCDRAWSSGTKRPDQDAFSFEDVVDPIRGAVRWHQEATGSVFEEGGNLSWRIVGKLSSLLPSNSSFLAKWFRFHWKLSRTPVHRLMSPNERCISAAPLFPSVAPKAGQNGWLRL